MTATEGADALWRPSLRPSRRASGGRVQWWNDPAWQKPLVRYSVAASHNSHLRGAQVCSGSPRDDLRHVLRDGARMVELDVHGKGRGAVITHAWCTPAASLHRMLNQCATAVAAHLPPLFISLDMHKLTAEQDAFVATALRAHLGAVLLSGPLLPGVQSPADLRGKVVLLCVGGWRALREGSAVRSLLHGVLLPPGWKDAVDLDTRVSGEPLHVGLNRPSEEFSGRRGGQRGTFLRRSYPRNLCSSSNSSVDVAGNLLHGVHFISMNYQTRDTAMQVQSRVFSESPALGLVPLP